MVSRGWCNPSRQPMLPIAAIAGLPWLAYISCFNVFLLQWMVWSLNDFLPLSISIMLHFAITFPLSAIFVFFNIVFYFFSPPLHTNWLGSS